MSNDAIRRFMGELKPPVQVHFSPAVVEAAKAEALATGDKFPAAAAAVSPTIDPFVLLEQQFGKAVADQARKAAQDSVVASIPSTARIPTGIGESLMRMRTDVMVKSDPQKVMSANRRFMPDRFEQSL